MRVQNRKFESYSTWGKEKYKKPIERVLIKRSATCELNVSISLPWNENNWRVRHRIITAITFFQAMLALSILRPRKASFIRNDTISYARESLPCTLMITQPCHPFTSHVLMIHVHGFPPFSRGRKNGEAIVSILDLVDRMVHYLSEIRNKSDRSH